MTANRQSYDGVAFREMMRQAHLWLEKNAAAVNTLNVFPVPDGDTGSNMSMTMRSGMEAADACTDTSAGEMAAALAHGSLLGARGNAGVILSQILRGIANALSGKQYLDAPGLAEALELASATAYKAMAHPVEGTILSVIRCTAADARSIENDADNIPALLEHALDAARAALADTPNQLQVLKDAGVVDAGGQGLVVLLEGALAHAQGRTLETPYTSLGSIDSAWLDSMATAHGEGSEEAWGYCTQFVIKGQALDKAAIDSQLWELGKSVLAVGDEEMVHVHVHMLDPGVALSLGTKFGSLHSIKIDNMQEQSEALHRTVTATAAPQQTTTPVVAVAQGEGIASVFLSLGTAAIVPGGQSMNPSTQEIATQVDRIPSAAVALLPNNPNVVAACEQVDKLTTKRIVVVPSKTVPQGIAALLAINEQRDFDANVQAMQDSLDTVASIEITTATRGVDLEGHHINEGDSLGLLDRKITATGSNPETVIGQVLDKLAPPSGCLITVYYGQGVSAATADELAEALRGRPEQPEVEVAWGGQPHYPYLLSVEA